MVSALSRDGLDRLLDRLAAMIPAGPWLYPEDQIAEAPIRSLAAEITREKLIERLHDELPYQATVETDEWKDLPDGAARIEQTIFVSRESHRKIVLGEGGRTIKAIGTAARKDITASPRRARAPLPARQGAREMARRPGALPGDGARVPQGVGETVRSQVETSIPGAVRCGLSQVQSLKLEELLSLACVDEQRCRSLAAGEVERTALLAVEPRHFPGVEHQAKARRRGRGGRCPDRPFRRPSA